MRYLWGRMRNVAKGMFLYASLFCVAIQPFSVISVYALAEETIIINEFSANGADDWVELYNSSSETVSVEGWQLRDTTTSNKRDLSGTITARGFLVVEFSNYLNANTDTIRLLDSSSVEVATLTYTVEGEVPYPGEGQSTARAYDDGPTWLTGVPTKALANDTQAPPVPGGGSPHDVVESSHTFPFSWQAVADPQASSVTYQLRGSDALEDLSETEPVNAWYSGDVSLPSIDAGNIPRLGEGIWYWQVRARDATGNLSAWSATWHVRVDTQAPAVSIAKPSSSVYGAGAVDFLATITEKQLESFTVELDAVDITSSVVTAQMEAGVQLLAQWSELIEGPHTVRVRAVDAGGRSAEAVTTFEVDKTAPVLISSIRQGSTLKGLVSLDVTSQASDVASLDIEVTSEKGEIVTLTASEVETQTQELVREWDTTQVQDGIYTIRFTGTDAAGNTSTLIRTVRVVNMIVGGIGVVLRDPLLEQLSVSLSQPFTQTLAAPFATTLVKPPAGDIHAIPEDATAEPIDLPLPSVAATENGWRVFGILWYWWLFVGLLVGGLGFYSWRMMKRRQLTNELDGV